MRILVIGGSGFLGRHLIAKLRTEAITVRVFGRGKSGDYTDFNEAGIETVRGDIGDLTALTTAMRDCNSVFHLAAKVGISGRRAEYYQTNVIGTKNVVAACRAAGVKKLIYTSTPSVVFENHGIAAGDETLPYAARCHTAYAQTKIEAEKIVLAANEHNLLTCALRPHLIWGPGDTNLIPRLIARAQTGKLSQIGDGKNLMSVSYVENTADAHLAALAALGKNSTVAGGAYFVNETEPVNCWDFIRRILAALGLPKITGHLPFATAYAIGATFELIEKVFPNFEPPLTRFLVYQLARDHYFSSAKARRDFDWVPKIGVDEGIERLRVAAKSPY